MRRIKIGVHGASAWSEWGILPVLLGPDLGAAPDASGWWSRRPAATAAIRWQAPFRPEVLAISDEDEEKRARLAGMFRIPAQYPDARAMLAENNLDAVFCANAAGDDLPELVALMARRGAKYLWLGGAPAPSAAEALELAHWAAAHGVRLWCGRNARHAAAHRAAIGLVKRGEIGDVTALALRWSAPFCAAPETDPELRSATFAALDLLLACAGAAPTIAMLSEAKSTSHLWLSFTGGATATAIFASADNWNSPLPRLEICGTQGRFLVCEGGRRMGFFQPHEAARWIEPPGLAAHVSSSNVNGLGEDIKLFLTDCSHGHTSPENIEWLEIGRTVSAMEAARQSVETGAPVTLEKLRFDTGTRPARSEPRPARPAASPPNLTLPLNL